MTVPVRVHLALLFVQLGFAGLHVLGKLVLEQLPPLAVASFRVMVAAPVLLLLSLLLERQRPTLRDLPWLALLGFLGVFSNQLLFIIGLSYTTPTNAAVLMPSIPVFATALAVLARIEALSRARVLGVGCAVAGALVVLDPGSLELAPGHAFGNLLVLINCFSYASFLVLSRPLLQRLPALTVTAWAFLLGGSGVLGVGGSQLARVDPSALATATLLGLAYIALVPTCINYLLNFWAIKRSTPSLVASYITLQPLATGLLAWWLRGEQAGWRELLGGALILTGLALVSRSAPQRASLAPPGADAAGGAPGTHR